MIRGGQVCLQGWGPCWCDHMQKGSSEAAVMMAAAKLQEVVALYHAGGRQLCEAVWVHQRVLFFKLKSCQMVWKTWRLLGARPKTEEIDCCRWKMCRRRHCEVFTEGWRQKAHCWFQPGTAVPAYVALDLWLKLGFPAGWCARAHCHFPCRKIAVRWQIAICDP